jgi:VanZ family protein
MGGGGPRATRIREFPGRTPGIPTDDDGPSAARPGVLRTIGLLAPPLALMGLVWFLSAQPDLNSGLKEDFLLRKCAHVTEYAFLTLLWARAIAGLGPHLLPGTHRRRATLRPAVATGAAAVVAVLWAASDEWHQTFVRGRVGAVHDVGIDGIGVAIAVVLLLWTRIGVLAGLRPRRG